MPCGLYFKMDLKRFFIPEREIGEYVTLTGEEFAHAVNVTRHKTGYKIILFNNTDFDYYATITEISKNSLTAKIDSIERNLTNLKRELTLCIGACKELDTVVQKAVELGVTKLVPFRSQHTNIDSINIARLRKIVLESSKQCGRSRLMEITDLTSFESALNVSMATNKLAFYEYERENRVRDVFKNDADSIVFIGSEGGFSAQEVALFRANGYDVVTLGNRILRVGTAVVSAVTLVLDTLGEM